MSETGPPASIPAWVTDASLAAPVADELVSLLDHYEQALFGFVSALLSDRDVAGDCVQDTFLRAYRNLLAGRPVTVQWLYRVDRNRAIDELRHRWRVRHGGLRALEQNLVRDTAVKVDTCVSSLPAGAQSAESIGIAARP